MFQDGTLAGISFPIRCVLSLRAELPGVQAPPSRAGPSHAARGRLFVTSSLMDSLGLPPLLLGFSLSEHSGQGRALWGEGACPVASSGQGRSLCCHSWQILKLAVTSTWLLNRRCGNPTALVPALDQLESTESAGCRGRLVLSDGPALG